MKKLKEKNYCFIAGTKIAMQDGTEKNIEDVVIGDEVTTYEVETGFKQGGLVSGLVDHSVPSVMNIVFEDDSVLKCTGSHEIYVKDRGWVRAVELSADDVCKKLDGSDIIISQVLVEDGDVLVYNLLDVGDNNNFYADNILVNGE
tara:strand:+ start:60 stop:494 length:435 start_codon:yes stop_codon:yes gene_type:complete